MNKETFLEDISEYFSSRHPDIFMDAYYSVTSKDFLIDDIYKDEQKTKEVFTKYNFNKRRLLSGNN